MNVAVVSVLTAGSLALIESGLSKTNLSWQQTKNVIYNGFVFPQTVSESLTRTTFLIFRLCTR